MKLFITFFVPFRKSSYFKAYEILLKFLKLRLQPVT